MEPHPIPIERNALNVLHNGKVHKDIVHKDYEFDANTETLLWGDDLVDGMIVLADRDYRIDFNVDAQHDSNFQLLKYNRWCRVTKLRPTEHGIAFIAEYADGQKMPRYCEMTSSWVVKVASIPQKPEEAVVEPHSLIDCVDVTCPQHYVKTR